MNFSCLAVDQHGPKTNFAHGLARLYYCHWTDTFYQLTEDTLHLLSTGRSRRVKRPSFGAVGGAALCQERSLLCLEQEGSLQLWQYQSGTTLKYKPKDRLILFQFLRLSTVQLLVVTSSGVTLCNVESEGVRQLKLLNIKPQGAWWQPFSQTIFLCQSHDSTVVLPLLFQKEVRDLKESRAAKFALAIQPLTKEKSQRSVLGYLASRTGFDFSSKKALSIPSGKHNGSLQDQRKEQAQSRLIPLYLYGQPHLALVREDEGRVLLYGLRPDRTFQQCFQFKVPSDSDIQLTTFDNLLVVHLCAQRFTILFDTKRVCNQPLFTPQPLGTGPSLPASPDSLYEGRLLSKWAVLLDSTFLNVILKVQQLIKVSPISDSDLILVLQRRTAAKNVLFKYIRQQAAKLKLLPFSTYWKVLLEELVGKPKDPRTVSLDQICDEVLVPLHKQGCQPSFLKKLAAELSRQAMDRGLSVHQGLHLFLLRLICQLGLHQQLYFLYQHQVVKPSFALAELAFAYSQTNPAEEGRLRQLAFDVYHRLGQHQKLGSRLLALGLVEQGVAVLRKVQDPQITEEVMERAQKLKGHWRGLRQLRQMREKYKQTHQLL